jgi:type II secretory pathway component PulF
MRLAYVAFDRAGAQVSNAIDAASESDARDALRRQGLFVTKIHVDESASVASPSSGSGSASRGWSMPAGRNRRLRQLTGFTRQLQVLVMSGTPLVQALAALERQAGDADWRAVLAGIRTRVEEGAALSSAMEHYPKYFDAVCRSLISAGESSGKLEPMLDRLAKLTRKQLHVRSSIRGAMIYPILLTCVSAIVLVVLLTFVLPRFAEMFVTLDAPLPPTTQFVMALGEAVRSYWWAIGGAVVAVIVGGAMWLKSPAGRAAFDMFVLRVPIFGTIVRNFATARIARLLGVQLEGKVPLLEALALTRQAAGNVVFAGLVEKAEEAATKGQAISASFAESKLMPPTITEAMRSGEATGQMATLLLSIADFLDEENDTTVRSLTTIIEPVILIVMGVCVGFVAVSMFLPMFDLTSMASQGPG